ncbi:MAG: hypothetical protein JJ913_15590 [Rhizobiaceae bacterium]|nr:hypothetical protein [Rhizobiaceae bacterium]
MKTIEQTYTENVSLIEAIASEAASALSEFCTKRSFSLVQRIKAPESLRDKIETGRYANLEEIDDIVAFSVIIDTLSQEREAKAFLRKAFLVERVKSRSTLRDERSFDFDCTRVYCRLSDKMGNRPEIENFIFEVQIRTLLQHAWSKITHSLVYKAQSYDERASRLAAELMAQIESADRTFSRFKTSSKAVKRVTRTDAAASAQITAMFDELVATRIIPSELRPVNGRRLGENVYNSIQNRRKNLSKAMEKIRDFATQQKDSFPSSVSLFQLSIVALHKEGLLETGGRRKRSYYVTNELISLFPEAKSIPNPITV